MLQHQYAVLADGRRMRVWTWDERVQARKADDAAVREHVDRWAH